MNDTNSTATPEKEDAATSIIPPHIRRLLGEAPLLKGESVEEFNALLEQLAIEANPKDFTSWLLVAEKAAKLWECGRLQRMARAVDDSEVIAAAKDALGDLKRFREGTLSPEQVAGGAGSLVIGMQSGDPEDTAALRGILEGWGINTDTLYARAIIRCQDRYTFFKKQADRTRNDMRLIDRDRERHLFALTQRPKSTTSDAEDIDFKEAA